MSSGSTRGGGAVAEGPGAHAGVRLILSDSSIGGGQCVKTVPERPGTLYRLVELLCETLRFEELCTKRGFNWKQVASTKGSLHIAGFDGPRRVPIRADEHLIQFFTGIQHTKLPSLEIQLVLSSVDKSPSSPSRTPVAPTTPAGTGKRSIREVRDEKERLEEENFHLLRANDKVDRRVNELERLRSADREETERLVDFAKRELTSSHQEAVAQLQKQIDALVKKDTEFANEMREFKKHVTTFERQNRREHQDMIAAHSSLSTTVHSKFEDVETTLNSMCLTDDLLKAEDERQNRVLAEHLKELKRLDGVKVEIQAYEEETQRTAQEVAEEFGKVGDRIEDLDTRLTNFADELTDAFTAADAEVRRALSERCDRMTSDHNKLEAALESGLNKASDALEACRAQLQSNLEVEITSLTDSTTTQFKEVHATIKEKDVLINRRTEQLQSKTELTFKAIGDRLDEMVKAQRARLGKIEKEHAESTAKTRSDFRSELDRLRGDVEQADTNVVSDLTDLHKKHDVLKQEINFFQSRLLEIRDWAQKQLTETTTAMRAAQVDSQEAQAAASKMIHVLHEDAIGFRDKMAKHVSLLQHSSDSQGDALNTLESQRSRLRLDLDALINDHKAYTADMDGWADDVRVKVERLFKAMEPPRLEWRIDNVSLKTSHLKKPLSLKSSSFSLKGVRESKLELFPEGTNQSAEGKAVVRVFLPPTASVRFQVWLGQQTHGSRDFTDGHEGNLSVDLPFDNWREQVEEDGSLRIAMEVTADHHNLDEALSREVRIETR